MDWSSVFEENGEEAGDWERSDIINRLEPLIDLLSNDGRYTKNVMFAFTINYVLGVGCLGIPYAFDKAGILLGTVIMIFISFVTWVTVLWVAEAAHRGMQMIEESQRITNLSGSKVVTSLTALKLKKDKKRSSSNDTTPIQPQCPRATPFEYSSMNEIFNVADSQINLTLQVNPVVSRSRAGTIQSDGVEVSTGIEPEVIDLALAFLGPPGKTLYQVSLMCLTYAGLLAYAQVFQQTLTAQLLPTAPPFLVIIFFACIVVPLSCFDLSEQIFIQVSMFFLMFGMLSLLIFGTVVAIFIDPYDNDNIDVIVVDQVTNIPAYPYPYWSQDIPIANYAGFGAMFSTALFSQLFQHSVPGLIRPLSQEDKAEVPQIFANALVTTAAVYIVLGVTSVSYFGEAIKGSISLNFVGFSWGLSRTVSSGSSGGLNYLADVLAFAIVLFPALDTLSIFPLIANTLGNNLHACFPESRKFVKNSLLGEGASSSVVHRKTIILWRLVASIPPIFMSAFVTDISLSLQLAGICGIIVSLIIPSLLQRYSREKIHDMSSFLLTENPYSTRFSDNMYTNVVLVIAIIALAICMCQCMY